MRMKAHKSILGKSLSLALLIYLAILPVAGVSMAYSDPPLAWWEIILYSLVVFVMISKSLMLASSGKGRVKLEVFEQRLWPAFWLSQRTALVLTALFGIPLALMMIFGKTIPDLETTQRIGRAGLIIYFIYWLLVLELMNKTASWPEEIFMPTFYGIWHLKWGWEVSSILVIVFLIIGGQFLTSDNPIFSRDLSWLEILFGVDILAFAVVGLAISKGEARVTD